MEKIFLDGKGYESLEDAKPHLAKAAFVEVWYADILTSLDVPLATSVRLQYSDAVTCINAPLASRIHVESCDALTTISSPLVAVMKIHQCDSLTAIDAPLATRLEIHLCDSLTVINAPFATSVDVRGCNLLTKFGTFTQLPDAQCHANLKSVANIALASPDALCMDEVHVCDTTHCIAGTAIHFLKGGKDMETKLGWWLAGKFLLGNDAASHFGDTQEGGLEYLQGVVA